MMKYLLLDLDGTLIRTVSGKDFPENVDDWCFKEGMLDKLNDYYSKGYKIAIITNQGGIGKGFVDRFDFKKKISKIREEVKSYCGYEELIPVFVADSMDHRGRKPSPYFANQLCSQFQMSKESSLYVGDASGKVRIIEGINHSHLDKIEDTPDAILRVNKRLAIFCAKNKNGYSYFTIKNDHSDSDLQFARNSGIPYMDIDDFLKPHEIK